MEQGQETQQEVFENDIQLYLSMFCEEQGIENLKVESQSVWNGCLLYINRYVFKNNNKLKTKENIAITGNCNAYDMDIVNSICDYYVYLCSIYDKEISIIGFSKLTGISQDCIYEWARDDRKLSRGGCEIYKKLTIEREESLSNKLVTGRIKNPVGVLGVLNRHFSWNVPGIRPDTESRQLMGANELPKLSDNSVKILLDGPEHQDAKDTQFSHNLKT